ncbi:MAG: transcriptional repressor [Clostridia bacterium]|nr:transcriptional repressor [Clostridia bacterium]
MPYKTRQRGAILEYFAASPHTGHTARDVIEALGVSEATVFRTLTHLTDKGLLKRFTGPHGSVYQYSGCGGHHMHLKCKSCGTLVHLECSFADEIMHHFAAEHHFMLDKEETIFYGFCEECRGFCEECGKGETV